MRIAKIAPSQSAQPRWGGEGREARARRILRLIESFLQPAVNPPLKETIWCDLGCGSGLISSAVAEHVAAVTGVDPDPWPNWPALSAAQPRLRLVSGRFEEKDDLLAAGTVDIVVCNQVYEHVDDPRRLIACIHRILKPGGLCYFAGPNLLFPIEPHTLWPFVHWLPRRGAVKLMRALGSRKILDANSTTIWTLRCWLSQFDIHDAVPRLLAEPRRYGHEHWLWQPLSWIPSSLVARLLPLSPAFILVLRKPWREP